MAPQQAADPGEDVGEGELGFGVPGGSAHWQGQGAQPVMSQQCHQRLHSASKAGVVRAMVLIHELGIPRALQPAPESSGRCDRRA